MTRLHAAFFAIALAAAGLDLATKSLAFSRVPLGDRAPVIDGFFEIAPARNPGMAWSLAQGWGSVLLWVSVVAVPVIVAIFLRQTSPLWTGTVALALVLGGTLGNLYDRAVDGSVRDFIRFYWWPGRPFPTFNIADACICVGVALLVVEMLFFGEKKPTTDAAKPEDARPEEGKPAAQ